MTAQKVTFLGLGAMGSRMAANLVQAGYAVTVWNRSPRATEPLAAQGARVAETPLTAAQGAAFVISMVTDDAASAAVWLDPTVGALAGLDAGAVAIESSTVTPGWIDTLSAAVTGRGAQFIEAPVSGSLPQAEARQLVVLAGGEPGAFDAAAPILSAMGTVASRRAKGLGDHAETGGERAAGHPGGRGRRVAGLPGKGRPGAVTCART